MTEKSVSPKEKNNVPSIVDDVTVSAASEKSKPLKAEPGDIISAASEDQLTSDRMGPPALPPDSLETLRSELPCEVPPPPDPSTLNEFGLPKTVPGSDEVSELPCEVPPPPDPSTLDSFGLPKLAFDADKVPDLPFETPPPPDPSTLDSFGLPKLAFDADKVPDLPFETPTPPDPSTLPKPASDAYKVPNLPIGFPLPPAPADANNQGSSLSEEVEPIPDSDPEGLSPRSQRNRHREYLERLRREEERNRDGGEGGGMA